METEGPPWENTPLGRVLSVIIGVALVVVGIAQLFNGGSTALTVRALILVVACLLCIAVIAASRTSVLYVDEGRLVAYQFWGERSMPLASITRARAQSLTGIVIRSNDGSKMRSLVSVRNINDLPNCRANRIAKDIFALAESARREPNQTAP